MININQYVCEWVWQAGWSPSSPHLISPPWATVYILPSYTFTSHGNKRQCILLLCVSNGATQHRCPLASYGICFTTGENVPLLLLTCFFFFCQPVVFHLLLVPFFSSPLPHLLPFSPPSPLSHPLPFSLLSNFLSFPFLLLVLILQEVLWPLSHSPQCINVQTSIEIQSCEQNSDARVHIPHSFAIGRHRHLQNVNAHTPTHSVREILSFSHSS